mgnify:CR=1 FL=1
MKKRYSPGKRDKRVQGHISFEPGHEFYGAELDVWLDAPTSLYLEITGLMERDGETAETLKAFGGLLREFADRCLIDWNIDDDAGNPVPPNGDGLLSQDLNFVTEILTAWVKEAGAPSAPLSATSTSSSTSVAG